jgi:methylenetetrahydrofolate dehydrogenase (NADP+) / methenyltetrahydrofolate cyclohydrolase
MPTKPKIIDGKRIAADILDEVTRDVAALKKKRITPGLAVILVGKDPAMEVYVRNKGKDCELCGMNFYPHYLAEKVSEKKLLNLIATLNKDRKVHGIICQMPVPKHIDEWKVLNAISPDKDVDGFHPVNVGKMLIGEPGFLPCTPHGCQQLLVRSGFDPKGKHVVVVGRSNIVGKPLAAILMQKAPGANATVTVCHSGTKNLAKFCKEADILVAAMGSPEFIKGRMVKEGAIVLDVGISRIEDKTKKSGYRLTGDVDFKSVSKKARAITPVPGGVGPMTRAMLLTNTVQAAKG